MENLNILETYINYNKIEELLKKLGLSDTYLYTEDNKNYLIFLKDGKVEKINLYNLLLKTSKNKSFKKILMEYDYKNFNELYADLIVYFENKELVVKNIVYKYDFKQKEEYKIKFFNETLFIQKNNIEFLFDDNIKIDKNKLHYYLESYLKVFPYFIEFLNFITYNLFDAGRKRSYVYINAPSDWGKNFLLDLFSDLEIGIRTQINKLEKIPSPLSPEQFKNKILLMIDEFTIFKKELKELTNKFILEPKNKKQVEVQLFTKLFVSAEFSESFDDAVDEQIKNRIVIYNFDNTLKVEDLKKENINLDELHLYLKYFIKEYLKRRIDFIKRNKNYNVIEKIDKIFNRRKIKSENIELKMLEYFLNLVSLYENNEEKYINIHTINDLFYNKNYKIIYDKENEKVYITAFPKFLKYYLSEILDESNFKKYTWKFKKRILSKIFEFYEVQTTINGINNNFYVLDLKYLRKKYEIIKRNEKDINQISNIKNKILENEIIELKQKLTQKEKLLNEIINKYNKLEKENERLKRKLEELGNSSNTSDNSYNKNYNTIEEKPQLYVEPLDDDEFPF